MSATGQQWQVTYMNKLHTFYIQDRHIQWCFHVEVKRSFSAMYSVFACEPESSNLVQSDQSTIICMFAAVSLS